MTGAGITLNHLPIHLYSRVTAYPLIFLFCSLIASFISAQATSATLKFEFRVKHLIVKRPLGDRGGFSQTSRRRNDLKYQFPGRIYGVRSRSFLLCWSIVNESLLMKLTSCNMLISSRGVDYFVSLFWYNNFFLFSHLLTLYTLPILPLKYNK